MSLILHSSIANRLLVNAIGSKSNAQCGKDSRLQAIAAHRSGNDCRRLLKSRCGLHGLDHRLLRTNVRLEVDSPFQAKAIQRLEVVAVYAGEVVVEFVGETRFPVRGGSHAGRP